MDPSGKDSFENQWRKALMDASETPPPSVWEGIEAHLEKDNKTGLLLPLWLNSPRIWFAAASIAALLLIGAGIWYSNKTDVTNTNNRVAVNTSSNAEHENSNAKSETKERAGKDQGAQIAAKNGEAEPAKSGEEASLNVAGQLVEKSPIAGKGQKSLKGTTYAAGQPKITENAVIDEPELTSETSENPVEIAVNSPEKATISENLVLQNTPQQSMSVQLLASIPYSDLDVHMQKRYVFFRPEMKMEEPAKLGTPKEYWAGISLMPASFNPDLKVKSAPMNFNYQALANKKSVSGTSESGVSYALQTQGGMKLSKHWSLELGVSYLKGNSDYQGGGYLLSANNSTAANVLENALAGIAPSAYPAVTDKNQNFNAGAIYVDVSKKSSNNYQYLQLPVQAGFTVYPEKKLSYSLLGGMMANFFLTNDLESASGEIIKTTASDEIYRTVNWAATTGLRFNYRLSAKWKASLTGSYQKAVSSGFRSNQSLDVHPYLYGVAWGVRYSF